MAVDAVVGWFPCPVLWPQSEAVKAWLEDKVTESQGYDGSSVVTTKAKIKTLVKRLQKAGFVVD